MKIRPYIPSDLPQIMMIYHEAIHSLASDFYTPQQLAAWSPENPEVTRWEQRLAPLQTILADAEGVVAGFACYTFEGHLDLLFTKPAYARRGVATQLCVEIERSLRAAGVTRIFTEASLAGYPFFQRFGFEVDAPESVDVRGVQLRRYRMHKQIAAFGD